jgi:hypothetical protein
MKEDEILKANAKGHSLGIQVEPRTTERNEQTEDEFYDPRFFNELSL